MLLHSAKLQPLIQVNQKQMRILGLYFLWYPFRSRVKLQLKFILLMHHPVCSALDFSYWILKMRKVSFCQPRLGQLIVLTSQRAAEPPSFVNCQSWQQRLRESSVLPSTQFSGGEGDRGQLTHSVCAGKPHAKHMIIFYLSLFLTFKPSSVRTQTRQRANIAGEN